MLFDITTDSDTVNWKAELDGNTANFYILRQDELDSAVIHEDLAIVQPFYPAQDGSRRDWLTLDSAVNWFKNEGH